MAGIYKYLYICYSTHMIYNMDDPVYDLPTQTIHLSQPVQVYASSNTKHILLGTEWSLGRSIFKRSSQHLTPKRYISWYTCKQLNVKFWFISTKLKRIYLYFKFVNVSFFSFNSVDFLWKWRTNSFFIIIFRRLAIQLSEW